MNCLKKIHRVTPDTQFRISPKTVSRLSRIIPIRLTPWFFLIIFAITQNIHGLDKSSYITSEKIKGSFPLFSHGKTTPLIASTHDYPGVLRVVNNLKTDMERVTNINTVIYMDTIPKIKQAVLIGTLGKSPLINQLMNTGKLHVEAIQGKWETFMIQKVDNPFKNVKQALVIVGSDKRGTIYGMYDLSEKIGVSPWTWWADVPPKKMKALYVLPGRHIQGEPAVKYRGIFLNDEEPCLGRWAVENYGGFNHQFYEKVFELILRLKGNFLWPAMWWAAFNIDDPENPGLADEMGIVMSTSHHEPMLRSQQEWKREGSGAWNYETNGAALREFWRQGIRNMDSHESIITLAMRGDGDMAMSEDTNIALLEKIVEDQREIISDVTGKDITTIPQVWALYKEVQDYYDKGMTVPNDVTLLLCDDNWGNVRRLPKPDAPPRSGGYGMYYHFDFVGGPRSYKWLNTNPIPRVWEQMHLCYKYGVDRIWLVNVGDLKPMEFPISFFLNYAWNPDQWPASRLTDYTRLWAEEQFGPEHASDIADILTKYTKYNGRRKPEMLEPDTYSLIHYREAETVVADYNALLTKAENISKMLPSQYQDAYYELVLHPVKACANLNDLYVTVAKNRLYAAQGRAAANDLTEKAEALFEKDAEISHYYNKILADGKWNHMMDQTHIGYTYWNQPEKNTMPEVIKINLPDSAEMGVSIEGTDKWWPAEPSEAVLPEFDPYNQSIYYITVFNRGKKSFDFSANSGASWFIVTPKSGRIEKETQIKVSVDWPNAPKGIHRIPITLSGPNETTVQVTAVVRNPESPKPDEVRGFVENNGYISIEAEHCTRAVNSETIKWLCIPNLSRTLSGMTPVPVTAESQHPGGNSPRLEYSMHLFNSGEVEVHAYFSPTQNFLNTQGLRYGISFDNEPVQIINIHINDTIPDWKYPQTWNEAVSNNIKIMVSKHTIKNPGEHVLKLWMADPGLVLQKIVVDTGGLKPTYLGPPESYFRSEK